MRYVPGALLYLDLRSDPPLIGAVSAALGTALCDGADVSHTVWTSSRCEALDAEICRVEIEVLSRYS
jgi:hypothetical protein